MSPPTPTPAPAIRRRRDRSASTTYGPSQAACAHRNGRKCLRGCPPGWDRPAPCATASQTRLPEALAALHAEFERIHPFLDGNGRTGRLVLNLLLIQLGHPSALIYKSDRARYLAALRRADKGENGALGELLARAILDNLYKFIAPAVIAPAVAGSTGLLPLAALASRQVSADALRVAAARGRLKAMKGSDGVWRSTRAWVQEYAASRGPRGIGRRDPA
jgi:hypothetical protein